MKVPISDYELVDLDAPVLAAYEARIRGVTCWMVWCKHCGVWHRHGAGPVKEAALRVEHFERNPGEQVADAETAVNALERECEALKSALVAYQTAT